MTTADTPRLRLLSARLAERPWRLRLPFHYGDVTLTQADEVHLSMIVEVDGAAQVGFTAELAAPKWFEKTPNVTPDESAQRLWSVARHSLSLALDLSKTPRTIAQLELELREELEADSVLDRQGITRLERSFGVALVERAAIDALCRAQGAPFEVLVRDDRLGLDATLAAPARSAYRAWRRGPDRRGHAVAVRHTVGLGDPLASTPWEGGRPVGLADVIAFDGVASFKVKLPSTADDAVDRLEAVATVLDSALTSYRVTLDANEAYLSVDAFAAVVARVRRTSTLGRFWSAVAYIEQPLRRDSAFDADLARCELGVPVIIDESDDHEDAFARALSCGYGGVSLKTCKGVLHGLRNVALARTRGAFVTMEDLSVQPGVALQQNLALAACLAVPDCERNGHHYGPGSSGLPPDERAAFESVHPDLYSAEHGRLLIEGGMLSLRSTRAAAGFGTVVVPSHPHHDRGLADQYLDVVVTA